MRSRIVRPERRRIPISDGDWIEVKERLNAGEYRHALARLRVMRDDGAMQVDPLQVGIATMIAYLLDWSLVDLEGRIIPIRGEPSDVVEAALNALDVPSFEEIRTAILDHESHIVRQREEQKKTSLGSHASETISPSPVGVGGGMSG